MYQYTSLKAMRPIALCLAILCGCSSQGEDPDAQHSRQSATEAGYVRRQVDNESVIIFVHGVTGNATSTWTNGSTGAYWPQLIVDDLAFRDEDVFVYEYPSPKIGTSYNINELAEDFRLALSNDVIPNHKRVIFLAHSMGGLIVRQYLLKYRNVADKVPFMYFYATPTTGSPMTTLATLFSKNPQLGNLKPMKVDDYLGNLQRDWLAAPNLRTIPSFCAYETQNTLAVRIVEQESATNLCNQRLDPINANHIEIVKPGSRNAKPYQAFKSAYIDSVSATTQSSVSGLRVEIENVVQGVALEAKPPQTIKGERVFCDSIRLSLLLARVGKQKAPILINSIALNSAPLDLEQLQPDALCITDKLSSVPYGIIEKNVFFVSVDDRSVVSRYLKDASHAVEVESTNILVSEMSAKAITLKEGEEPVSLDIIIQSVARLPHELTFTIGYDQDGEESFTTKRLVIWN